MFHVELRQFPNLARAFNLSKPELEETVLRPWAEERPVLLDDRRWSPEKAKLTIYEGPALEPEEMGLGRSWGNVTRRGEDVTARMVEQARAAARPDEAFKRMLEERGRLALPDVIALAAAEQPGRRASESLALAEQAVWELLHQGRVRLRRGDDDLMADEWQAVLLAWASWCDADLTIEPG